MKKSMKTLAVILSVIIALTMSNVGVLTAAYVDAGDGVVVEVFEIFHGDHDCCDDHGAEIQLDMFARGPFPPHMRDPMEPFPCGPFGICLCFALD
jgi:hypothetical protein